MKVEVKNDKTINWDLFQLIYWGELIILTNGRHSDGYFEGTVIQSNGDFNVGQFIKDWGKGPFSLFTGSITLEND